MNDLTPHELWSFLIPGYLSTLAIETPFLLFGLSRPHPWRHRLAAAVWLNACSYPIVVIAMPAIIGLDSPYYLPIAETFAPLAECALFSAAYHTSAIGRADRFRDWITIILANLASFLIGEWLNHMHFFTGS